MTEIPFLDLAAANQEVSGALEAAFQRVMQSSQFILDGEVASFEQEFAGYCNSKVCVGVGNGLEALVLILRAFGIGPGDEVLVPSNTFIATWLAVTQVGATPVPVEPEPSTYNIDPAAIKRAITPRSKAVIAVHLYGQPAQMEALGAVTRHHGLRLIEDAAQAHGARYAGRRVGALADAAAFSFYPSKNLGALGDGGAVVTDDLSLAAEIRRIANYGSREKYVHDVAGCNSRLDELQAAFLRCKLPLLDEWNGRRQVLAQRYIRQLEGAVVLPRVAPHAEAVWHLFVVRVPNRDAIAASLKKAGIGTQIHYPVPPLRSGAYAELARHMPPCPVADELSNELLSLPLGPHMTATQVDRVCDALLAALHEHSGSRAVRKATL